MINILPIKRFLIIPRNLQKSYCQTSFIHSLVKEVYKKSNIVLAHFSYCMFSIALSL